MFHTKHIDSKIQIEVDEESPICKFRKKLGVSVNQAAENLGLTYGEYQLLEGGVHKNQDHLTYLIGLGGFIKNIDENELVRAMRAWVLKEGMEKLMSRRPEAIRYQKKKRALKWGEEREK